MMDSSPASPAGPAPAATGRATAIVVAVLGLLLAAKIADATADSHLAEVPFVAAAFVLPVLFVLPAVRPWWLRHRFPLLAAQAVITYVPVAVFGDTWVTGLAGLLAGLVLLTVTAPASWLLLGMAAAGEAAAWAAVGVPADPGSGVPAVWVGVTAFDILIVMYGLTRLGDLVASVHAAREELAVLAVSRERKRAAQSLRMAVGTRAEAVAALAGNALAVLARQPDRAREHIAQAGDVARQAIAEARGAVWESPAWRGWTGRPGAEEEEPQTAILAPRLAQALLLLELCGFAAGDLNNVLTGHFSAAVNVATIVFAVAILVLQLCHSHRPRDGGRPRAWPVTLAAQALLTYGLVPSLGWRGPLFAGFLAGSVLLLLPAARSAALAFAAVVAASLPFGIRAGGGTWPQQASGAVYYAAITAGVGLLVYGLSRLSALAAQMQELQGELARAAARRERERVARDTHDLLGLGLSAVALKADLAGRLLGRDDAAAAAQLADMRRICAAARGDLRRVTGDGVPLSLDAELAAAREILACAGIEARGAQAARPVPAAGGAVLAPVLREAVANVLRHSQARHCVIETVADADAVWLRVSNDGVPAEPGRQAGGGQGLANLAARVEAAGGSLTTRQADGCFWLEARVLRVCGECAQNDPHGRSDVGGRNGTGGTGAAGGGQCGGPGRGGYRAR